MYLIDFFKKLFKKNNIGIIIWMILNASLICLIFATTADEQTFRDIFPTVLIGLLCYLASLAIALSPIGETILRWQNGCYKVEDPLILERIQPIFDEVYAKAKSKNPELSDRVKLYMVDDDSINAFAVGRKTVCCTKGLLILENDEIRGILGHEFGHLAHKDTDILLVITIGNLIISALFVIWRFVFNIMARLINLFLGYISESFAGFITGIIVHVFIDFLLVTAMSLWTKLGVLICRASSRATEYQADQYSYELGYGNDLCRALRTIGSPSRPKGLWATLSSTHPPMEKRINKLYELLKSDNLAPTT